MSELPYHCEFGKLDADQWHSLLCEFDDATVDQTQAFAHARWPSAEVETVQLRLHDEILAAAQVVIFYVPGLGARLAYIKFGPMWRRRGQPENLPALRAILRGIRSEYCKRRGLLLRIYPASYENSSDSMAPIISAERFGNSDNKLSFDRPLRFVMDLTPSEEVLHAGLKAKWRYNLRRTERHSLNIFKREDATAAESFMELYRSMLVRKHFHDDSAVDVFPSFHAALPSDLRPTIVECQHRGETLAMAVIDHLGDRANYLYGASNDQGRQLGAGYALQWWIVLWLRELGVRVYDLGQGNSDPGLRQFKTGLVGTTGFVAPMLGNYEAFDSLTSYWIVRTATGLRDIQQRILERLHER
jgi:hypothetical protein